MNFSRVSYFWRQLTSQVAPLSVRLSFRKRGKDVETADLIPNQVLIKSASTDTKIFLVDETLSTTRESEAQEVEPSPSLSSSESSGWTAFFASTSESSSTSTAEDGSTEDSGSLIGIEDLQQEIGEGNRAGDSFERNKPKLKRRNALRRYLSKNSVAPSTVPESSSPERRYIALELDCFDSKISKLENGDKPDPTYLDICLDLMYTACWSPFNPNPDIDGFWSHGKYTWILQLVLCLIFTSMSSMEILIYTKNNALVFLNDGNLENFTNMGFYIMGICTRFYFAYIFTFQQAKLAKMLKSLQELRAFARIYSKVKTPTYSKKRVVIIIATSVLMSVLSAVFDIGVTDWTLKKAILDQSFRLAVATFTWKPETLQNATHLHNLYDEYGTNLTTKTILFGIINFSMLLCSRIQTAVMGDLILFTAATLRKQMSQLAKEVGNPAYDAILITVDIFEAENGKWAHYLLQKKSSEDINNALECLLKYKHVDNLMLCVYLAMNAFDGTMGFFSIMFCIYNIIKISCTYRIATKASENNETFRKWIRRLARKGSDQPQFVAIANLILDELEKEPLGLGKGQFMIDESFMFRFMGTVGSVFVLQAQSREDN